MATEVKLPELGENLEGGEVLDVKVSPGAVVSEGQTLLEIDADKATVEVPAPIAGRVDKLLVQKGDRLQVGQVFCLIEGANGKKKESQTAPPPPASAAEKVSKPAAPVQETQPAESDGQRRDAVPPVEKPIPRESETAEKVVPAGPATRRLARELGVDLRQVRGSGRGGRVIEEDVKAHVRGLATGTVPSGPRVAAPPLPDFARWGPVERQALAPVRRRTAQQVSLAWSLVPHVTQHDQADITDLDAFRKQQEGNGPKLTVTAFALKAVASALRQFPAFNASLDPAAGQLILKHYYHIGVAVDTEHGLLVPVIRDVDKKSVRELAQELTDVAERARQKKLPADEMRGGTFTVTNLGGIGGTGFSPIVNYPEVAILGLSRARRQPVVHNDQVVPRLILPLSLSYDHRAIDGADAARFARRVAEMLENPLLMLL